MDYKDKTVTLNWQLCDTTHGCFVDAMPLDQLIMLTGHQVQNESGTKENMQC